MTEQPKIKIKVRPSGAGVVPGRKKEEPKKEEPVKRKKGLIRKIVEIVSNDIHNLPNKIWGKQKEITMPESNESWRDWEGQL